jgi:hypothetical protein
MDDVSMYLYYMATWSILWPFGIFGIWVHFFGTEKIWQP